MLYYLALASRIAEGVGWHWNTWVRVGEVIARAEAYACQGRPGPAKLEVECRTIEQFIEKHQGQSTVSTNEIGNLRDQLRDMVLHSAPREWQARGAGGWMGYSAGTCEHSLKDGKDRAVELRNYLRTGRENLHVVDPGVANRLEPIEAMAAQAHPPYDRILAMIEALDQDIGN
jgi:hypothetical protein